MLEAGKHPVEAERSTRSEPLSDADARALLAGVERVLVARGRAVRELSSAEATLADLKGPTGNYRAPMIASGKTLLVGFSRDALTALLAS